MFAKKNNDFQARVRQVENLRQELSASHGPALQVLQHAQEYAMDFELSESEFRFRMVIFLPPDFPAIPPSIRVLADIAHPLLNDRGEVTNEENLRHWNSSSSLSRVILNIIAQFRQQKPVLKALQATQPGTGFQPNKLYAKKPVQAVTTRTPTYERPPEFDDLQKKTDAELEVLLNDKDTFDEWFGSLQEVEQRTQQLTAQTEQNAALASLTLSRQDNYESLLREVHDLRRQFQEKRAAFDDQYAQHHAKIQESTDKHLLAQRLQVSINDAEGESEAIAAKFIDGDLPLSEFIKEYREHRKLYHVRSAKLEMLQAL